MTCDQCHERDAVVHLTQIVDAQVTTLHLCERCAAEKGVEPPSVGKSPLGSFLAAMGKELTDTEPAGTSPESCHRCGATLRNFRETGRLGCPECWKSFEPHLRELVRRLHGSTFHVGERYVPAGAVVPDPDEDVVAALRDQLRAAVDAENFELAAELRDRLRVLE